MNSNAFIVRENACPTCGCVLDAASAADLSPTMPEAGDISICIQCGEILQFDKHMKLNKISEAELNRIASIDARTYFDAIKAQGIAKAMAKARGDRK